MQLAARIEKIVLFSLGIMEELWRWGMVRLLIRIEGGKGGFRGRGGLWDLAFESWDGGAPDDYGIGGEMNTKYPTIWEAVYFMGWTWSVVETSLSWYSVRPTTTEEIRCYQETFGPSIREDRRDSPRRPLLGKRTRSHSDYHTFISNNFSDDDDDDLDDIEHPAISSRPSPRHSFFESFRHKRLANSRRNSKLSTGEPKLHISGSPHIEGSSSPTACNDSATDPTTPKAFGKSGSLEAGELTPRASRALNVQPILGRQDGISDNDYGDDEGSLSDFETSSLMSSSSDNGERIAPILSSSLPYDPETEAHYPHHRDHVPHRQASYSTLGDNAPALLSSSGPGHSDTDSDLEDPRRRIYPSFPSYSSSYNHTHFPQNPAPHPPGSSSANTVSSIRHYHTKRRVYGVSVDRLHAYLPVMWRTASLLRHIGHAMMFAWAPALVFKGRFQWWCLLVLTVLALRKGYNTLEWFGGGASRKGLLRSSTILLFFGCMIYLTSLGVWGLLW
ncbi:hypothetical protein BZA77DRAFT_243756 [Pyronema omphalodes]|nr:hypothetical protein BZA77DRAFT_243756 [Pyronema omphalodes]